MTKAVYAIFFFFFLICLTFTLSFKAFAQDQRFSFSYMAFFKQAVLTVKVPTTTSTPTPKQVLGVSTQPTVKPTTSPSPSAQPTSAPTVSLSSVSDYLLTRVNQYRATQGLPAVQSSAEVCAFATTRAGEIAKSFTHAGFNTRIANHTLPYAHWTRATENIAETADYKQVVDLWINSPEHAANMRDNTPYVCVAQNGKDYAYEGMRP